MVGEHDTVEIVRELVGVRVLRKVPLLDAFAVRRRDDAEPIALELLQPIAHWTGSVVELGRGGDEQTATGHRARASPVEPAVEQAAEARLAPRLCQGWSHNGLDEPGRRVVQHLDLERFLGAEMTEQTALGELQIFRERADGETPEADSAGERDCALEDGVARVGALARDHGLQKSTIVRFCQWPSSPLRLRI